MTKFKFFRYQEELDKYLKILKSKGFDSIRFPGGTSKNGKNGAFVICEYKFANEKYYLVLPYKSSFHLREKVSLKNQYESPKETAAREFNEEVHIKIDSKDLEFYDKVIISSNLDNKKIHKKYFFRYRKENSDFLQYSFDFDGNEEETSAPFFIKSALLRDNLFWKHYQVLKNGWRKNR